MFCWSFWVDPGFREELSTISWELQVLGTCEKVSKKLFTSFKLLQFRGISWGCLLHLCLRVGEIDDTGCCVSVCQIPRSALVNLQLGHVETYSPWTLGKSGAFLGASPGSRASLFWYCRLGCGAGIPRDKGNNSTQVGVCYCRCLIGAAGLGLFFFFFQSFDSSKP